MEETHKIYVHGGQLVVTEKPSQLITILGSCVSVCLWDRKLKIGGMNHYLLPANPSGTTHATGANNGVVATQMLIQFMIKKMSSLKNLEAKIFGGGNRFFASSFLVVGPQNVDAAKRVLGDAGIPIVLTDTGGQSGRKIYFNTDTGDVAVSLVA